MQPQNNDNVNFSLPPAPVSRPIPFRWIFPVGQLVLCLILFSMITSPLGIVSYAHRHSALLALSTLNLPAGLVQLPEAIFRADHQDWMPPGVDRMTWQAVSWPVLGMVFWWIAGRAVEALAAIKSGQLKPKIGWTEAIVGFLLMAAGATFMGGMLFGLSPAERSSESTRLAAAGGLWALLGALSVIARFRQWRLRKKMSATA